MKRFLKYLLIFLSIIFILLLIAFCFFFVGKANVQSKINWGVDFSQSQAEYLKLDWKDVYSAIINDLGTKNIKLHTNWSWVEGKKDNFYFSDTDWQVKQAEDKNVKIIYVLGMKTGRWPECHIPDWAQNLSEAQQQSELFKYVTHVVQRYKDSRAIAFWQVENEPFFKFGECPAWYYKSDDFLTREVALVKSLDPSRKVIVSDSGEGSMWFSAAKIGDIVGTTMYREAWAHISDGFGFHFHYFFSPVFYSRKALLIQKLFGKDVICIELQAEPWSSKPIYDIPLSEQSKTMNLQIFKDDVKYAKETGLNTFYFWGAEWWYWMKDKQNQPQIWNEAKNLFR